MTCALAAAALGAGCEDKKQTSSVDPPSRVNASKTGAQKGASVEAFCDVQFPPGKGPLVQWPALAGGAGAPASPAAWRWINVWATWCKPCVEEMPRLRAWQEKRIGAGKPYDLVFVSVDESDAEVAEFRKAHPDAPPTLRLADPAKMGAWFRDLGLTGDPPIPIHVFVDTTNRVRCARAGGVRETDHPVVEKLLSE
jgi:thiol-disulfide isomerase/thioredoxin